MDAEPDPENKYIKRANKRNDEITTLSTFSRVFSNDLYQSKSLIALKKYIETYLTDAFMYVTRPLEDGSIPMSDHYLLAKNAKEDAKNNVENVAPIDNEYYTEIKVYFDWVITLLNIRINALLEEEAAEDDA